MPPPERTREMDRAAMRRDPVRSFREMSSCVSGSRCGDAAKLAILLAMVGNAAQAKDFFLTIAGGYDPSGNPASLERNVNFATDVLKAQRPDQPPHEIYFADGDEPLRDVQYVDGEAASKSPAAVRVLAELFGDPKAVGFRYRDHNIPNVAGPTDHDVLERRFRQLGRELKAGDRLFVYVAGHGGEAYDRSQDAVGEGVAHAEMQTGAEAEGQNGADDATTPSGEETPFNHYDTSLYLWGREEVTASEFSRWLDRLPRDVTVVLVMTQCYSGGFSHVIFPGADADLGLSPARRCGFFSQLHNRAAAGCAAELDEDDVEEYSTYFWAAIGGRSRTGENVSADFGGDGSISLAEAHAYAVIESDTIDVPVRTSEALLRAYSRLGGPFEAQEGEIVAKMAVQGEAGKDKDVQLLEPSGPITALAAKSRPDQRAILDQLPARLAGARPLSVEDVRVELEAAQEKLDEALEALDAAVAATDDALAVAQDDAYELWPELYFAYSTAAEEIAASRSDEFVASIEQLGSYGELIAARKREDVLSEARDAAECAKAKVERLLRTIEDVVLAENLPKVAPAEMIDRYQELIGMEEQSLRSK
jgi:hypothetical protein